jgi:hypothetical protein
MVPKDCYLILDLSTFLFFLLLGFTPLRWRLVEWGSLLNSIRTRLAIGTISSVVRASMAHFNAVLKINFFFSTYTQPENFISLKLHKISSFNFHTGDDYPPSLITNNQ